VYVFNGINTSRLRRRSRDVLFTVNLRGCLFSLVFTHRDFVDAVAMWYLQ